MTSIVLTQPHTHAGQAHKAGERLDVDGSTADWLIANGIARHGHSPAPVPQTQGGIAPIVPNEHGRRSPAEDGTSTPCLFHVKTTQRKESRS